MFARSDKTAIWTPCRAIQKAERLVRYLMRRTAFEVECPNIIATCAIAGESNTPPIGAILRLHVPRESAC